MDCPGHELDYSEEETDVVNEGMDDIEHEVDGHEVGIAGAFVGGDDFDEGEAYDLGQDWGSEEDYEEDADIIEDLLDDEDDLHSEIDSDNEDEVDMFDDEDEFEDEQQVFFGNELYRGRLPSEGARIKPASSQEWHLFQHSWPDIAQADGSLSSSLATRQPSGSAAHVAASICASVGPFAYFC